MNAFIISEGTLATLQLSPKGAVLEGFEETVKFGQRSALRLLELVDSRYSACELALRIDRRAQHTELFDDAHVYRSMSGT